MKYFELLNQAKKQALLSKKSNTKVGAILVDINGNLIIEACNDYIYPLYNNENYEVEDNKNYYSEHAERRLIYLAIRYGVSDFNDKTLVITHFPCCDCARAIILVGIKSIVLDSACFGTDFFEKWKVNLNISRKMLEFNNVNILYI